MQIFEKLQENIEVITGIDQHADKYPELCRLFRRTSTRAHLLAIMEHMRKAYSYPAFRGRYYAFSINHLMQWSAKELGIGGRADVWQSHAILLQDMGLVHRIRPNKDSTDELPRKLYEIAAKKGGKRRAETLWAVPLYNRRTLQQAERIAAAYHGLNTSHLTKADVERIRGRERADLLFESGIRIPHKQQQLTDLLTGIIRQQLEADGYTTADRVTETARAAITQSITQAEQPSYYSNLSRLWERQKNVIINQAGAQNIRATNELIERYNLPDRKNIIIRAVQ